MVQLALNAITGFSTYPLKLLSTGGVFLVGLSLFLLLIYLLLAIFNNFDLTYILATWLSLIFLSGILLIGMGILGEYIGRTYDEAKGRPLYIVAEGPKEPFNATRLENK
jgi:dolichol-phosphate mannosyltransferase